MVRYFEEGLKPSIKAEMDQDASHLDDYKELVAKAVRAKAKAGLRPSSYIQKTDQHIPQRNWLVHTTVHKVQTHGAMKDYYGDKSKAKASVSTSTHNSELFDNARKDKKKKQYKAKWEGSTPAIRVNTAQTRKSCQKKKKLRDLSMIMCFNCNKRGHYASTCPEQPKN